jgi:hypothetical protein
MKANLIATLRQLGALVAGLSVLNPSPPLLRAQAAPAPVAQPTNTYATDVSITHLDISLKADFQSNRVSTVVKATLENTSAKAVDKVAFLLCTTVNDRHFHADVKRIQDFDEHGEKDLPYIIREIPHPEIKQSQAPLYEVPLARPVPPGGKFWLRFEYTMAGKPDHSSAPIEQAKNGVKEIYLRGGGDYRWCPSVYRERQGEESPGRRSPSWTLTLESPEDYVAVTDGARLRRSTNNGWVKDEWKSLVPGRPYLFVGPFKMASRTIDGMTFEMYSPDEPRLRKAAVNLEKYARMFNLYSELYGNLGVRTYRIVCSAVAGVGVGTIAGQTIDVSMMNDTRLMAHEMAHAWWGHWVSPYGPGWKFLSEAMAEFSAQWALQILWEDDDASSSLTRECILGWKQRHFSLYFPVTEPLGRLPAPLIFQAGYDSGNVTGRNYHWGPLVVNQIRLILGDEVFFRCLKAFLAKYGGKHAGIDEFVQTINTVSQKDLTSELKGLLWSTGFASYRLAGFVSEKADRGYRTQVRIANEGDYGLTCPLLLRTIGGEQRRAFKVEAKQEKEFVFRTEHRVIEVIVDPEVTTLQYHPEQKLRLWRAQTLAGNNECSSQAYMHYALGDPGKAVDRISEYLESRMRHEQADSLGALLTKASYLAPYVFMRGVFYLGLEDPRHAEEDVKSAFPYMLRAMVQKDSVRVPSAYYEVGAIARKDLDEYLALLGLIAGREFSLESALDDPAKKRRIEQWQQWWDTEGQHKKLHLDRLKENCEAQRRAFQEREVSLAPTTRQAR